MKIHFIGIGGIGVSALARYYLSNGWEVSGSDLVESEITQGFNKEGVRIYIGSNEENIKEDFDKVVYSVAVKKTDPELLKAKSLNIETLTYAEALAGLTEEYFTIAVSGSHGKGTTTAMLSLILIEAGLDPTVIIGTRLKEFNGTNFRKGKSKYLLIEADEYDRSFLKYKAKIAVVTNVDAEHLDIFGDINGVVGAFNQYLKNLPEGSIAVLNKDDNYTDMITIGYKGEAVYFDDSGRWALQVPGEFNQSNADAAWKVAEVLGIEKGVAARALKKYNGAWRRMEELEALDGFKDAIFYSDYGHHPTEILATVKAIKSKHKDRKLLLVYQPHQVKRLEALFGDFIRTFKDADELVILPIYEVLGREDVGGKTSEGLVKAIKDWNTENNINQSVSYLQSFDGILTLIQEQVVVFMGAGDIDKEVRKYFRSKLMPAPS